MQNLILLGHFRRTNENRGAFGNYYNIQQMEEDSPKEKTNKFSSKKEKKENSKRKENFVFAHSRGVFEISTKPRISFESDHLGKSDQKIRKFHLTSTARDARRTQGNPNIH